MSRVSSAVQCSEGHIRWSRHRTVSMQEPEQSQLSMPHLHASGTEQDASSLAGPSGAALQEALAPHDHPSGALLPSFATMASFLHCTSPYLRTMSAQVFRSQPGRRVARLRSCQSYPASDSSTDATIDCIRLPGTQKRGHCQLDVGGVVQWLAQICKVDRHQGLGCSLLLLQPSPVLPLKPNSQL